MAKKKITELSGQNQKLEKEISEFATSKKSKVKVTHSWEDVTKKLTRETESYLGWIDNFKKKSKTINQKIFDVVKQKVTEWFRQKFEMTWSGSVFTGLQLPWSDCNFEVKFFKAIPDFFVFKEFENFCRGAKELFASSLLESKGGIIILKLKTTPKFESKNIEIIFKRNYSFGPPSKEEIIMQYLKRYPALKPLYIVIKSMLNGKGLDDPSQGGLVNLGLILMIVSYIQQLEISHKSNANSIQQTFTLLNEYRHTPQSEEQERLWSSATETICSEEQHFKTFPSEKLQIDANNFSFATRKMSQEKHLSVLSLSPDSSNVNSPTIFESPFTFSIGELLLGFFSFFGHSFDYNFFYLHPNSHEGKPHNPICHKNSGFLPTLIVKNPYSPSIIITKNFKRTLELQNLLKSAFVSAFSVCSCSGKKILKSKEKRKDKGTHISLFLKYEVKAKDNSAVGKKRQPKENTVLPKILNICFSE